MLRKDIKKLYKDIELEYYDTFDKGHDKKHLKEVYDNTEKLCKMVGLSERETCVALIAAMYHDSGISRGRLYHNIHSYNIVMEDPRLKELLTEKEIKTVAYACRYHRSRYKEKHKCLISKIVADADNIAPIERHIERSIYFTIAHDGWFQLHSNVLNHLRNKFGRNGYAKLLLKESNNLSTIERNYDILDNIDEFDKIYYKVENIIRKKEIGN